VTTRQQRERDFHDRACAERTRTSTDRFYAIDSRSTDFYRQYLAARCDGQRVLEYGCGRGSAAFFLAENGAAVTGIDISPVAIEQATREAERRSLADRVSFEVMDAEALRFDDDSFGLVCGTAILHHLDIDRAYSELARVLLPSGGSLFLEPLGHNPVINFYRRWTPHLRTEDEHPLRMSDLQRASRYFGDVRWRFFELSTLLAVPARRRRRFDRLVAALARVDETLFRVLPGVGRYAWVVAFAVAQPLKGPISGQTHRAGSPRTG
jgi:SAM-dependent methyltransferase